MASIGGTKMGAPLIVLLVALLVGLLKVTTEGYRYSSRNEISLAEQEVGAQEASLGFERAFEGKNGQKIRRVRAASRAKRRIGRRQQISASKTNQSLPEFGAPIGNVSAVVGRDVRLVCTVDNLGDYQVAWLKEETKTILSIDTNIIITNYRIFLIPDEEERKWVLHIKDVQESDRGFYQCQVNTKPMRSTSGYLEVVVPPQFIESQTSQVAEAVEHSNVSLQCKARGHPKATISWRRDDGTPIKLTGEQPQEVPADALSATSQSKFNEVRSDKLTLVNVHRSMGGQYVCTADNGVPSQVSKTIALYVKFAPQVSVQSKYVSISLGDQLELDCLIESFPRANSYWSKQATLTRPLRLLERQQQQRRQLWQPVAGHQGLNGSSFSRVRARSWPPFSASSAISSAHYDAEFGWGTAAALQPPPDGATSVGAKLHLVRTRRRLLAFQQQQANELGGGGYDEGGNANDAAPDLINLERDQSNNGPGSLESEQRNLAQSKQANRTLAIAAAPASGQLQSVSVKQTPINPYTYRLRMTIAQMSPGDYGDYACHAANALGSSETRVIVTKADRRDEQAATALQSSRSQSLESGDFQRDDGGTAAKPHFVQVPNSLSAAQSHHRAGQAWPRANRVYDENYLQAIKSRQLGLPMAPDGLTAGKLQQPKGRLRVAEKSAARKNSSQGVDLVIVASLASTTLSFLLQRMQSTI